MLSFDKYGKTMIINALKCEMNEHVCIMIFTFKLRSKPYNQLIGKNLNKTIIYMVNISVRKCLFNAYGRFFRMEEFVQQVMGFFSSLLTVIAFIVAITWIKGMTFF